MNGAGTDASPGSRAPGFNLSALALRYPQVSLFALLVIAIAGTMAFMKLGQREDPAFTFRAMVIRTIWPGATTEQVDQQVTDRIEKSCRRCRTSNGRAAIPSPGNR